nr:hypothetical protein [uncultured Brumimicrobium sp.]
MKSKINLIKSSALLILALSIIILTSCGGQNEKSSNQKGTYDGTNSCELINTDDIRSVFNLSNTVEVEQTKKHGEICYYKWRSVENNLDYSVRFAFARWDKKSDEEVNKTWEKQNESTYNKHNMQVVPGVGDKASWSDYEKGQLRVAAKGHFFYISIYVSPKENDPMSTDEKIEKTSTLAKQVIQNI